MFEFFFSIYNHDATDDHPEITKVFGDQFVKQTLLLNRIASERVTDGKSQLAEIKGP